MALDDFLEPEVGVAVVLTAAVASPRVRKTIRQGLVYGLAGLLIAGDKLKAAASGVAEKAREVAGSAHNGSHEPAKQPTLSSEGTPS
jgi:hypothetical protein